MLTINGQASRFCDGVSRRNFLRIGALGMGGLALPQILQAEAQSGIRKSHKAVIMIYLPGGPPHQDTFDLKLDAPVEIRGEFKPIRTNVPGVQICEHLPRMAGIMDKLAVIRSMVDARDDHSDFHCLTGRTKNNQPPGGWPSFGAVISKLQGAARSFFANEFNSTQFAETKRWVIQHYNDYDWRAKYTDLHNGQKYGFLAFNIGIGYPF